MKIKFVKNILDPDNLSQGKKNYNHFEHLLP